MFSILGKSEPQKWGLALILAGSLVFSACSDDSSNSVSHDSVSQAWIAFSDGDWQQASTEFQQALQGDDSHAEAYCGLAWTQAMLGADNGPDYSTAIEANFLHADQLRTQYLDAWAGLAHFHSAQLDTVDAVDWAEDLLQSSGNSYSFQYRPAVDGLSIRKIAAWNRYKMQDYDAALLHVQSIFPDFQPDTGAENYLEVLLVKINEI